ncbi:MAG: tetratricopeptide repeat protein, partial [Rhodothermia bacterium]|nr:tetratricopeptide repeat protein [Rhodothermia bacterium]
MHPNSNPVKITFRQAVAWAVRIGALAFFLAVTPVSPSASQPANRNAEEDYQHAYRLFMDRLFELSADAFQDYQRQHPSSAHAPDALYYEAASLLGLGDSDAAADLFERFSRFYPTHPLTHDATLALGTYYVEHGENRAAIERFAEVLEGDATYELKAKALYWMGEAAAGDGELEEALRYYRRSATEFSASEIAPIARYAIGFTEVRRENYEAASKAFEELARRNPNSPYAERIGLVLAEIYYELGDYPRAVEELTRRMPSLANDDRERATFMLAESYNQLRRSEDAILRYREITEENPDSPYYRDALFGLGWNYQLEGASEWAADEFAKVSLGRSDALAEKATYYEAVNRKMARDEQAALNLFGAVVERWPNGEYADEAQYELGMTLYQLRQWQESNEAFKRFVDDYPDSPHLDDGLNHLGSTYIAIG